MALSGDRDDLLRRLEGSGITYESRELGSAWMIVAPALGARIMGLGVGEENALWVAPEIRKARWSQGGNVGGLRTWLAPEAGPNGFFFTAAGRTWDVPPALDPADYHELPEKDGWLRYGTGLAARMAGGQEYSLAITRSMKLDSAENGLRALLRHSVENTGTEVIDKRIGLWCIAQVPAGNDGTIIIPVRSGTRMAGSAAHPCYEPPPAGVLHEDAGRVVLEAGSGKKYKVGVSPARSLGRIAYVRQSRSPDLLVLIEMRWACDAYGVYVDRPSFNPASADNGDAVQAYNDPGLGDKAFSEIEAHAPAALLLPGGRQEQEIEITVSVGSRSELAAILPEMS